MNKLFKIGSVMVSAAMLMTATGITSIAEGEASTVPELYIYEDFENVTIEDNFKYSDNYNGNYSHLLSVIDGEKQYIYAKRQSAEATINVNKESDGNNTLTINSPQEGAFNAGQFARVWMKFDKEGNSFKTWTADTTSTENIVASYDVNIKDVYYTTADNSPICFFGEFIGMTADNVAKAADPDPAVASTATFTPFENMAMGAGLRLSMNNTNKTMAWRFQDGNSSTPIDNAQWFDVNQTMKVVVLTNGYNENNTIKYKVRIYHPNGTIEKFNGNAPQLAFLNGLLFNANRGVKLSVDNVKAYTLPADTTFEVTSGDQTNVARDAAFEFKMNGYIPDSELSKLIVKKNGEELSSDAYTITTTENQETVESTVSVKLNDKAGYSETYSVTVPSSFKNEVEISATPAEVSFTTEPAPKFNITLSATAGGSEVTTIAEAAGKAVTCNVSATLVQEAASSGTIFAALYDAEDNIVEYGSIDRAFTENSSANVKVSFKVPADPTGMKIKAFACESLAKLDPFAEIVIQ